MRLRRSAGAAGVLASLALLTGCTGLRFQHLSAGVAPDLRAARALEPQRATLTECLAALGAPLDVARDQQAGGRILTWEWEHVHGWGFFASLPLSDLASASLNFDRLGRQPSRLRLVFDEDWRLVGRIED